MENTQIEMDNLYLEVIGEFKELEGYLITYWYESKTERKLKSISLKPDIRNKDILNLGLFKDNASLLRYINYLNYHINIIEYHLLNEVQ